MQGGREAVGYCWMEHAFTAESVAHAFPSLGIMTAEKPTDIDDLNCIWGWHPFTPMC